MAFVILLDAGLLGLACSPPRSKDLAAFDHWLGMMIGAGADIVVPDISRYEVRRELIRLDATARLFRLDQLTSQFVSAPVLAEVRDRAAEFWAIVRQEGRPTAQPEAIDAGAILAGTASTMMRPDNQVVLATTNVRHLSRFPGIDARRWEDIH